MPHLAREISREWSSPALPAATPLVRLVRLHEEFAIAAHLAGALTRVPYAAYALLTGCGLLVSASLHAVTPLLLVLWTSLVLAAALGLKGIARQAERTGAELLPLRAATQDLNAMLLYAGFAWGSGAFLLTPALLSAGSLLGFSAGSAAVAALVLGARTPLMVFVIPVHLLSAAAVWSGGGTPVASLTILLLGAALTAVVSVLERRTERGGSLPRLFSAAAHA